MARGRRRHGEEEHSIADSELNLVPYLDIMVNLIMFMLLTFQVAAELRIINFNPPASGSNDGGGDGTPPEEQPYQLAVTITSGGFDIGGTDDGLVHANVPKANGKYDFGKLTTELAGVKTKLVKPGAPPLAESLIVVAEPTVVYDTVVKTLDAARTQPNCADKDPRKCELFPNVTLGLALEGAP